MLAPLNACWIVPALPWPKHAEVISTSADDLNFQISAMYAGDMAGGISNALGLGKIMAGRSQKC